MMEVILHFPDRSCFDFWRMALVSSLILVAPVVVALATSVRESLDKNDIDTAITGVGLAILAITSSSSFPLLTLAAMTRRPDSYRALEYTFLILAATGISLLTLGAIRRAYRRPSVPGGG